nr:MAG TPA: hypothetical protein [Caudoviricetes sp.]
MYRLYDGMYRLYDGMYRLHETPVTCHGGFS